MTIQTDPSHPIQPYLPDSLIRAAEAANQSAARHRFEDYRSRRAPQTLRRQEADLSLFVFFIESLRVDVGDLVSDPHAWTNISWGLVEAFVKWQIQEGYAIPSINVRLSTIKTYARLAMQSGTLLPQEYAFIRSIQGYSFREKVRIDQRRKVQRRGLKKALPVRISPEQARQLKVQDDSPQGRRDSVMMSLLLDHGLRVGELSSLLTTAIDFERATLCFFRQKVTKQQTHRLSLDALAALKAYRDFGDMPVEGKLLRTSRKNGSLGKTRMSERAITQRVDDLGARIGLQGLSAHDCRHYWATSAARHGTDPFALQEAGGWASLAMPRRYIEQNEIANQGVKLDDPPQEEL